MPMACALAIWAVSPCEPFVAVAMIVPLLMIDTLDDEAAALTPSANHGPDALIVAPALLTRVVPPPEFVNTPTA